MAEGHIMSDLMHRVVWTSVETFTATLGTFEVLDLLRDVELGVNAIEIAAAAVVAGVLTAVKEHARRRLNVRRTLDASDGD